MSRLKYARGVSGGFAPEALETTDRWRVDRNRPGAVGGRFELAAT